VPSVTTIASTDPRPTPAPDRRDKGDDSFSSLLEATAAAADNPSDAPPASPVSASAPPQPAKDSHLPDKQSPPPDNGSAPACSDPGQSAACGQLATAPADSDKPDADSKTDSTKESKPGEGGDGETPGTAVAADATAGVVQANLQLGISAVTVPTASDLPKTDGGGDAPAGDDANAVAEITAAAAKTAPANISAAIDQATPAAPLPPGTAKPPAEDATPAVDGPKIAAAIDAAVDTPKVQSGQPSASPADPSDEADTTEQPKQPNVPRSAAIAALAEKAASEAQEHAAVLRLGERDPVPSKPAANAAGTPPSPQSVDAQQSVDADAPKSPKNEPAPLQMTNAKSAPESSAPASIGTKTDADPTPVRPLSTPQLAQVSQPAQTAALPEPLRVLTTSLTPPASPVQSAAPTSLIPATPAAIAVEIAARAKEGSNQFDIRLDPPELGRIDVRLDVGKGGEVSTRLTIDRPETLQLLQNDARGLERALQSAGLKTDDGSLQFSLRQQTADSSGGQPQAGNPQFAALYADEDDTASLGAEQYQRAARMRGGVDIRV